MEKKKTTAANMYEWLAVEQRFSFCQEGHYCLICDSLLGCDGLSTTVPPEGTLSLAGLEPCKICKSGDSF